ncbi:macrophage killing protein with similarity to conjugation protein [mine drainage metagenome]|jgi:intracellular multiplication protein IcmL|uniref:Macrophage killing protein with similarity to conjugation protein n=1 Tax=mine drainage metagenome TaxID=410659 RepID=A0A1J5SPS0_9ZZZZ
MSEKQVASKPVLKNKDGIQIIAAKNRFWPLAYQTQSKVLIWQSGVSMVLIIGIVAIIIFRPAPQSYAVSPDGKITPLIPMTQGVGAEALLDFSSKAIIASFTLNFQDWKTQIGGLSKYYTEGGYNNFVSAIEPIKNRVIEGRYVTSIGFAEPPIIAKSAVLDGTMKYKVTAQILIGFEGQTKKISPQVWDISLIVERVSMEQSVNGIAISSVIAKPAK